MGYQLGFELLLARLTPGEVCSGDISHDEDGDGALRPYWRMDGVGEGGVWLEAGGAAVFERVIGSVVKLLGNTVISSINLHGSD